MFDSCREAFKVTSESKRTYDSEGLCFAKKKKRRKKVVGVVVVEELAHGDEVLELLAHLAPRHVHVPRVQPQRHPT
jgi:hypothetical protein